MEIKKFENVEYGNDWAVGDIVVSIHNWNLGQGVFILRNQWLEITEITEVGTIRLKYDDKVLNSYFMKDKFIALEDWKIKQQANKYNI